MSNPTRSPSVAHIPTVASSSSLLDRLLREINDHDAPRSDPIFQANDGPSSGEGDLASLSRRASLNCDISPPQPRSPSVWAKGGSVAEDARQKLRALDEARLRRQSMTAARFNNLSVPLAAVASRKSSLALPSPPIFADMQYNRAATFPTDRPSPTLESAINLPRGKRERSGAYSPDFITKKLRQESFPDMTCRDREYFSPSHPPDQKLIGGGSVVTTQIGSASLDDPVLQLGPLPEDPSPPPSPQYGFRSTPKHAYKPFHPATPCRSPTLSDDGSPGGTPTWARPLHLVEDDISIYKNVHGSKSQEHPLCLYCFRQHGEFHRVVNHRCEVCEQGEVLEGHYWEMPFRD